MFEYIIGTITFINPYYLVIETNGIGYQILVSNPYHYSGKLEKKVKIYLHQVIREDAQLLYGFREMEEKQLFLKLIGVSGIGPKSALAILALEDHEGLINAIADENASYLTKFPGVGKKTAQQMVLDLKGKLDELEMTPTAVKAMTNQPKVKTNQALNEALEALCALGYNDREIKRITPDLKSMDSQSTDQYLSQALKLIMK